MAQAPNQSQLIVDAIEVAERSLSAAKKLISTAVTSTGLEAGVTGLFDGEFMTTDTGKRYQVPPNYASKSMLVVGDTLRLIPGDTSLDEPNKFKQIEKIERTETPAVISKKDGKWAVVCEQGSFWVLPAAIKFLNAQIGNSVTVILPKNYKELKCEWATIKSPEVTPVVSKPLAEPIKTTTVKPIKAIVKDPIAIVKEPTQEPIINKETIKKETSAVVHNAIKGEIKINPGAKKPEEEELIPPITVVQSDEGELR